MVSDLKQRFLHGVLWSVLERFSVLFVQLACSLIIARQLGPEEVGLIGMLTIFSAIAMVIIEGGFSQALIQKQDCSETLYSTVFYANIILGIVMYVGLVLVIPSISDFYGHPELIPLSWCLFTLLPIASLCMIHRTLLTKVMDFKSLTKVGVVSALFSGIIGVCFAFYLKNAWALVIQMISSQVFQVVFYWIFSRWRPNNRFAWAELKQVSRFALPLLGSHIIGATFNHLYGLIIGKSFSATDLGYYTQARKIQEVPSSSITEVIQKVSFPLLSTVQDKTETLRMTYNKIFGTCLFIVVPIMFLLIVVAPDFFTIILSSKWSGIVPYFQILCVVGALYPINVISINIMVVKGNGRYVFYLELLRKTLMIITVFLTLRYSLEIFLYGYALYYLVCALINSYFSGKLIKNPLWAQLKQWAPIFLLGVTGLLLTMWQQNYFELQSLYLRITVDILCFAVAYFGLSFCFNSPYLKTIFELVRLKKLN